MIEGSPVNVLDYGADPTGVADSTAAIQTAFDENISVYVPAGTYLIDTVYLNNAGTHVIGAGKHLTTFQIKSTSSLGIARKDYGSRPDGTIATMMIGFELSDFGVDITNMPNADTSKGIAIEDGYDHTLRNIRIIDPLDETSSRWGLELGRALYTTSTYDCSIGRLNHKGNIVNSPYNFGTTVTHYKLDSWHVRGRAYQYVSFYMPVIQKDGDKFDLDQAISNWTMIGGDYEDSGNFIRVTTSGSVSNIFTAGNSFNGFKGTLFGGAAGRPQASTIMDEAVPQASRPITSITRAGSIVTVQVDTTLGNGIFKFMAPIAGQFITIAGCGAPFDGFFTVATANAVANSFTYTTPTSGAATGTNGTVTPDWSVGYTYFALGHNNLLYSTSAAQLWNRANQQVSGYTLHNTAALFRGDELGSFAPPASNVCYTSQPAVDNYFPFIWRNAAGTTVGFISCDASSTNYSTSSDYRLKTNVAPMSGALASVMQLKPCTFQWKDGGQAAEGFIAHELAEIIPSAVVGQKDDVWPDGTMKAQGVDSSYVVARLVAAIQELKQEFDAYKAAHP